MKKSELSTANKLMKTKCYELVIKGLDIESLQAEVYSNCEILFPNCDEKLKCAYFLFAKNMVYMQYLSNKADRECNAWAKSLKKD